MVVDDRKNIKVGRCKQESLIYRYSARESRCYSLPEAPEIAPAVYSRLTSKKIRVECCELALFNSYLSPQVSHGHYSALSRLLRAA